MENFSETFANASAQVQLNEANTLYQILFTLSRMSVGKHIAVVQTRRPGRGGKSFLHSLLSRLRGVV